jgi:hypothetical protein
MSLTTQLITIYCGVFFISAKDPTDPEFDVNNDFALSYNKKIIFFLIILACNLFFMLFWASEMVYVVRNLIKTTNSSLYIQLFLCCRPDKMKFEHAKCANTNKKEIIIQKIEDIVLFLNKMKGLYIKDIRFEDHERYLKMCYFVDEESKNIDVTEKKHNFYI